MPDTPQTFYLTTPIYYVNARPHIGHAYTTVVADVVARRHRLLGHDTFFLTGTDEHGQKIERSAEAAGIPPLEFADTVSKSFRDLWDRMGITYNDYIRTTEPRHKQGVQRLFQILKDKGYIDLSTYTGQYCVHDEAYVDGPPGVRCPDCGRLTETVSESNFYFRLSAFQLPLLNLIESNQLCITPDPRRNEVLSFLRGNVLDRIPPGSEALKSGTPAPSLAETQGLLDEAIENGLLKRSAQGTPYIPGALKDLSISRTSFKWGIPVPGHEDHVIYVWLDALANYMTAIGFGSDDPEDQARFEKYWPADLHLVGKEIIRFHCVYWPAFLLAAGLPTPKAITAHGWLLFDDSKMSKSKGNIVRTETILDTFGSLHTRNIPPTDAHSGGSRSVWEEQATSLGTFLPAPKEEQDLFASDVLRYFLLREIPFGQDGSFSFDALVTRYNADLANGYGNLVSRTLKMIEQSFKSLVPPHADWGEQGIVLFEMRSGSRRYLPPMSVANTDLARLATVMIHFEKEASLNARFSLAIDKQRLLDDLRASAEIEIDERGALDYINLLIAQTDQFISQNRPWQLAKSEAEGDREKLGDVLYQAAESIRIITALLYPFLPFATGKVWAQLGLGSIEEAAKRGDLRNLQWGGLQPGTKLGPLSPIFPRADKGLAQIMADLEQNSSATAPKDLTSVTDQVDAQTSDRTEFAEAPLASAAAANGAPAPSRFTNELTTSTPPTPEDPTHPGAPPRTGSIGEPDPINQVAGSASPTTQLHKTPSHTEAQPSGPFRSPQSSQPLAPADPAATAEPVAAVTPQITIDDFAKVDLRVATILICERIPKADKLLRLEVDLGPELGRRQILSGIAEWYTPEELIGRRIVVITNLAPRKMRGLESHGMLLAASAGEGGKPVLATFADSDAVEPGARLK